MSNCSHCGSPITGKVNSITTKDLHEMDFHADPSECYIKTDPIPYHHFPDVVRQEMIMLGISA